MRVREFSHLEDAISEAEFESGNYSDKRDLSAGERVSLHRHPVQEWIVFKPIYLRIDLKNDSNLWANDGFFRLVSFDAWEQHGFRVDNRTTCFIFRKSWLSCLWLPIKTKKSGQVCIA